MSLSALVIELNMLLAVAGGALALMRSRSVPGRRTYAILAFGGALWCAGELLGGRGLVDAWAGQRLAVLGMVLVGPFWLAVAIHLADLPLARRVPWLAVGLALPGVVLFALLFLDPWSALVLRTPRDPGPLWQAYTLYTYGLILAGSAVHAWTAVRSGDPRRRAQRAAIAGAGLLPLGLHLAYHWLGAAWPADPTPVALTPVCIALASALFPGGLLDVHPLVQQEMLDRLPLGVVLADRSGVVIDVNPRAEATLALSRAEAMGRALDAIVAGAPKSCRVEVQKVQRAARVIGQLAFLHPTGHDAGAGAPPD